MNEQKAGTKDSRQAVGHEIVVNDDFCGDCGKKFLSDENKITHCWSCIFGEYYAKGQSPICNECANNRYEVAFAEYESKNSR